MSDRTLTEILKEAAEHGEQPETAQHGIDCACLDKYVFEVRKMMTAAITPAEKVDKTPEEIERESTEDGDPSPESYPISSAERERELNQRFRIAHVLRLAARTL